MPVDLQEVQRAASEARKNFVAASEINLDVYTNILIAYLDEFLNAPVKKQEKVLGFARSSKEKARDFRKRFNDVESKVALFLLEQDLVITGATVDTIDLMLKGFGSYLDKVIASVAPGSNVKDVPDELYDRASVENTRSRVAELGYAGALAQQLAATLVVDHLEAVGTFCTEYLREKSTLEAIRSLNSQEVVDILFEVVGEIVDDISLIGLLKNISAIIDKKRARKAGVDLGDTDIMFELEAILARDVAGLEAVMTALERATALSAALRG